MLILTGAVFLLLALFSGLALLAVPFGLTQADSMLNWVTFPLFALIGPTLFMFSGDASRAAKVCGASGIVLVVLGLAGLIAAFLSANGLIPNAPLGSTPLWYVAGVGLSFGSGALAIKALLDRRASESQTH